jgi:hypothetical protein
MFARLLTICLMVAVCLLPTAAHAQHDEAAGKERATAAMKAYKEGDFKTALDNFQDARRVYPTGQVLRMLGYTLVAMQRWEEAASVLEEAMNTEFKPLMPRDAEHAEDQLRKVMGHLAVVTVKSKVRGATLSVDAGAEMSLPAEIRLLEGRHVFLVTAPGHDDAEEDKEIEGGSTLTLELNPEKESAIGPAGDPDEEARSPEEDRKRAAQPPEEQPEEEEDGDSSMFGWFPYQAPIGLATAGVGVVLTGIAIGTGIYGATLRGSVEDNIEAHNASYGTDCSLASRELCLSDIALINQEGERAQSAQNAALGLGLTGGALIAVGATLFLFSEDSPLAPSSEGATSAKGHRPKQLSMRCGPQLPSAEGSIQGAGLACFGRF